MIHKVFVFEERPNEAIDVLIEDVKSSSPKEIMPPNERGQNTALAVRECTFAGFMKCNPTIFRRIEGAIELRRWFEKTKSVFGISECAKGKKIRFATATLEGPALTWWNSKVETLGLENENDCVELEGSKECMTFVADSLKFNELALMYPRMVEPERVKVDAYIRGLTNDIKGEVTLST
ncbi:hypothetical protein Tco_0004852 [Tanacetum coccineum]